jgi:hypothetical protein
LLAPAAAAYTVASRRRFSIGAANGPSKRGAAMAWLFERMIETAAWVAFILGVVFFCEAAYLLYRWVRSLSIEPADALLLQAGQAAAAFVLSALVMGTLACIDRYVFDVPEQPAAK